MKTLYSSLLACALCLPQAYAADVWPGSSSVANADQSDVYGGNMSGLFWQPGQNGGKTYLWAVKNSPSRLFKLEWDGKNYQPVSGWSGGRSLTYTDGKGAPDAEGVTVAEYDSGAVYVASERNGSGSARYSVLRYVPGSGSGVLTATHEWNLTSFFTVTGDNLGPEAIAWVPDSWLLARSFYDSRLGQAYQPANYPNHGTGLFLLGMENDGTVHAFALNHLDGSAQRVASFASGLKQVMDLSFERERGVLWAHCDNNCSNQSTLLDIDTASSTPASRRFIVRKTVAKPGGMSNDNFEGMSIAPDSECVSGKKPVVWSNDSNDGGHALWRGQVNCGALY